MFNRLPRVYLETAVTMVVFFGCLSELYLHKAQQKLFNNVKNPLERGETVFVFSINQLKYKQNFFPSECDSGS